MAFKRVVDFFSSSHSFLSSCSLSKFPVIGRCSDVVSLSLIHVAIYARNANTIVPLISYSILIYDYLLTFSVEVERFWRRPTLSWAYVLFFANRYINLVGHIPVAAKTFWASNPTLHEDTRYNQFVIVFIQVIGAILMIMRVYALYDKNRRILFPLLLLGMVVLTVGFGYAYVTVELQRFTSVALTLDRLGLAIAWSGLLVFDAVIFALTLYKSWCNGSIGERTLVDIVLRDGTLYFAIMTAANVGNILTFLLAAPAARASGSTITNILSATMISRLMLNLRDPKITAAKSFPKLSYTANGLPVFITTNVSADISSSVSSLICVTNSELLTDEDEDTGTTSSGR
ncbi:hypothetical protein BJ138DRAFT_1100129 [Hygrophoropsis aurantiaca]|uniref:Uncharacterized protein n=1 Tax=Hygrophoropsis aurantiaca TaxID=72124 RepID=A0ACB8AI36_9AGAM|nr:hypothetical protein BJ138DRAFT_1100129 [Hygrophoropsis aurantiaca]